jgi:hypothetical protein
MDVCVGGEGSEGIAIVINLISRCILLVDTTVGLDAVEKRNLFPSQESKPDSSIGQTIAYLLTDSDIAAQQLSICRQVTLAVFTVKQ